jgi:hypothetical protein
MAGAWDVLLVDRRRHFHRIVRGEVAFGDHPREKAGFACAHDGLDHRPVAPAAEPPDAVGILAHKRVGHVEASGIGSVELQQLVLRVERPDRIVDPHAVEAREQRSDQRRAAIVVD